MKIENLDLSIINDAFERVGKRELSEEDLLAFAKEALIDEAKMLNERAKLFEAGKIKEMAINSFDFFSDGYRTALIVQINNDSLMTLDRDGDIEYKAKPVGDDGKRVRIVLRGRRGWTSVFLSTTWFEAINDLLSKSEHFVLVGGMTIQHKNVKTQKWERITNGNEYYPDMESYTFNLWQVVHIIKSGKNLNIVAIPKPAKE